MTRQLSPLASILALIGKVTYILFKSSLRQLCRLALLFLLVAVLTP